MSLQLDFPAVLERWPSFLAGAVLTLELAAFSTVCGAVLGTLAAVGRGAHSALIAAACKIYVEAIRNTPLLVQIFLVYFGLASLGLKFSAFTVAVAALTINVGAYTAEIMRAGFEAIPRGQIEAAEGLALSRLQIYWHIILLPAIEKVYPALTSQFVLLMLASSVCSQISAERTHRSRQLHPVGYLPRVRDLHHRRGPLHHPVAGDARGLLGPRPRTVSAPSPARHTVVR
ncbi:polar amino acid transport system permease protein [Bradyrhizobium sp. LB9.1b]